MYLIRKKPQKLRTYALLFKENLKEHFYKEVIFSEGPEKTDALPTLCESMNSNIVQEIVTNGFGFLSAILLALKNRWLTGHIQKLLSLRNQLIQLIPSVYIKFELFLGKYLSKLLIPSVIRKSKYKELLVLQVSERESNPGNIANFEKKLSQFIEHHPNALQLIQYQPHSFSEKIILNTRMSAALATLTLTIYKRGVLFPFDDAIMPGEMTESYASQLAQKLSELCPKHELLGPYLYGHDLKQINHNDWIITGELSEETLKKIHHVQCELVQAVGGHPHAEHGVGDYADTDLNYDELVKLVAHRLLNDVSGLANPGGAYQKAFKKAIEDKGIVGDAIQFAIKAIEREQTRFTLFNWNEALSLPKMMEVFHKNLEELRSRFQHEVN
ncbi:hypothetical protein Loa_01225 [Legionella oakridgensis ATCC 33761 = DSM 21215]|uniref:Uncharacterized protein n=2 Tax=Legionella oakridgensis TaxID=29423 RepID=W0BEF9_9GAMM|nr:hypothetical protein [Legionella oakridgensis]AHE66779.1 hypothetical protein Loa_01225 [Legionella oakridgensis ATCC 33761 = DSM 21215]